LGNYDHVHPFAESFSLKGQVFDAYIPGKKHALMVFSGGLRNYRERLKDNHWRGFKPAWEEMTGNQEEAAESQLVVKGGTTETPIRRCCSL
jgi:hypothetical protein